MLLARSTRVARRKQRLFGLKAIGHTAQEVCRRALFFMIVPIVSFPQSKVVLAMSSGSSNGSYFEFGLGLGEETSHGEPHQKRRRLDSFSSDRFPTGDEAMPADSELNGQNLGGGWGRQQQQRPQTASSASNSFAPGAGMMAPPPMLGSPSMRQMLHHSNSTQQNQSQIQSRNFNHGLDHSRMALPPPNQALQDNFVDSGVSVSAITDSSGADGDERLSLPVSGRIPFDNLFTSVGASNEFLNDSQQFLALQAQQLFSQTSSANPIPQMNRVHQISNLHTPLFPSSIPSNLAPPKTLNSFVSQSNMLINPPALGNCDAKAPVQFGKKHEYFKPRAFEEGKFSQTSMLAPPTHGSSRKSAPLYVSFDNDNLSEYQCLVRKHIEVFEASPSDVESSAKGRNRPVVLGQVGIRCCACAPVPPRQRKKGAAYFPAKIAGVYQAAQSLAKIHLCKHCDQISPRIRQELLFLKERKSSAGGGKDYWGESIRILGVYEDEKFGIRFTDTKK